MSNEIKYKGFTIRIERDIEPENPRYWDNLGTMACYHSRYRLGDDVDLSKDELLTIVDSGKAVYLPLYLLDHSILAMSTKPINYYGGWDTSFVGYIFATYETIRGWFGIKKITKKVKEQVIRQLRAEVEIYDDYLQGNVWGYTIEELGDSCWGYYGEEGYKDAIGEAKNIIDSYINKAIEKRIKYLKSVIKNHVPLIYRKPFKYKGV